MRCLYCGKELALFKRLTGGGEFCSDAHRQKYQEEYNQLALSRLLQTSPAAEGAGKSAQAKPRDGRLETEAGTNRGSNSPTVGVVPEMEDHPEETPVPVGYGSNGKSGSGSNGNGSYRFQEIPEPENPVEEDLVSFSETPMEEAPAAEGEEEPPAAPSGFLVETFQPHFALEPTVVFRDTDITWNEKPLLPANGVTGELNPAPGIAGAVSWESSVVYRDSRGNTRAPSVEMREMGRGVVNVNTDFPELSITGLEATNRPLEISLKSHAPQEPPALWEEPAKEFEGLEAELGDLARLAFVTLGWDEIAKNEGLSGLSLPTRVAEPLPAVEPTPESESAPVEASTVESAAVEEPIKELPVQEDLIAQTQAVEEAAPSIEIVEQIPSSVETVEAAVPEPEKAEPEPLVVEAPAVVEEIVEEVKVETPAPEPLPAVVTKPLPMTLHGHAPGRGKPVQVFPSAIARTAGIQIPRPAGLPLRPTMVISPAPAAAPNQAAAQPQTMPPPPVQAKEKIQSAPEPVKRETAAAPPPKKDASSKPDSKTIAKPAVPVKTIQPEKKDSDKPFLSSAPSSAPASTPEKGKPDLAAFRKAEERKAEERKAEERARKAEERKEEDRKPEERKAEDRKADERKTDERKTDERKIEERNAEAKDEAARKEAAAPVPVEAKAKKEPVVQEPIPAPISPSYSDIDLGLPSLGADRMQQGFWAKLPVFAKASVGAAILVAVAGGYLYSTRHDAADAVKGPIVVAAGNILSSGGAGWDTDWAPDPSSSKRGRRVSLMHASQSLSDYRMELEGQIETKAMGWVFRASNPKNFYVEKVEIVKPGLEPKIQLVRFAVIDGVEQPHQQVPLTIPVRPDTMYKVRFEAIGDRFTTWLMDEKVDEWTDARIASGGVGLYSESGESLSLKGSLNVVPLVVKH